MNTFPKEILDINRLYDGFQIATTSVLEVRARILSGNVPPNLSRFNFISAQEVTEEFDFVLRELEFSLMLMMLTAIENFIYMDFKRLRSKKKKFKSLKEKPHRITLEQILEVWKYYAGQSMKDAIGELNGALNLRHWLAHGRYWNASVGMIYSPDDILGIGSSIFTEITNSSI